MSLPVLFEIIKKIQVNVHEQNGVVRAKDQNKKEIKLARMHSGKTQELNLMTGFTICIYICNNNNMHATSFSSSISKSSGN